MNHECLPRSFLLEHGQKGLDTLERQFSIKAKQHPLYPNLYQLKYDQIHSPMESPLVRQCRGIILDAKKNWAVVARPFDKFFNLGEHHAAEIDWATARVQEKLDGSLCIMYYYAGSWNVATSGMPAADGEVGGGWDGTFAELFWHVYEAMGYRLPKSAFDQDYTFLFELMSPFNRIVVRHRLADLRLIGIRDRLTGEEIRLSKNYGWRPVREFSLSSIDNILTTFKMMDPLQQEGYVVVDARWNRIKVKHPGYVALHHLRGEGMTPWRALEVVRAGEIDELVANFPEWEDMLKHTKREYEGYADLVDRVFAVYKDIPEQKAFALKVKDMPFSGLLFSLRKGDIKSAKEGMERMPIVRLQTLLNFSPVVTA